MAENERTCNCRVCSDIRITIDRIKRVLNNYGWMLDAYVVDFFQDNLWEKIPKCWTIFLDDLSPEELGKWMLRERGSKHVWPLSLLALRAFIESVEISRDHNRSSSIKCSSSNDRHREDKSTIGQEHVKNNEFDNLFTKHVKKKKRYEIDVLSRIAAKCASITSCNCIVDIGAGMGHLARVLAYRHDLCVTCVEQNETLSETARKWDNQLAVSLSKHSTDLKKSPRHVSLQVGTTKTARQQLAKQLSKVFSDDFDENDNGFGIIGLHPCGDLAATLLRFFASEDEARFICIVGCCYMKLSLTGKDSEERGYPMSRYLLENKGDCVISYAALEVACHAVEKHCDKLKTSDYGDLKVHAYRAILECLLIEKNPSLKHAQLKNTKVKQDTTFEEYCVNVTENLEPKYRPSIIDLTERNDVTDFLLQWKQVLTFASLRLLLAPLLETIVLLDRFLYLSELNFSPSLRAEFDSRISPRNIVLVSTKQKKK